MTALVETRLMPLANASLCAQIRLSAPRANALEPNLMTALHAALDQAEQHDAKVILLSGGRAFSSGGDVARFYEAARNGAEAARAYADRVVPPLQALVLRLVSMPRLVAVAANGAITGGAAGLLFASDLAILSPTAFIQPYYSAVGFAPDGGWTALLPHRIGAGRTLSWLHSNERVDARDAVGLGLAEQVSDHPLDAARDRLAHGNLNAHLTAKALIWDGPRLATLSRRLEAETAAFRDRIGQPDVLDGMRAFLTPDQAIDHV